MAREALCRGGGAAKGSLEVHQLVVVVVEGGGGG